MEREAASATSISPSQLLHLAETHLRLGNFSLCREYALETLQSDPSLHSDSHLHAAQISAVAEVLLAASETLGTTNWYSVLRIDTFCGDLTLIRNQFKNLLLLLDPMRSKSQFANDALNLVWKAWNVLSNPDKKSEFDVELGLELKKESTSARNGANEDSFWTFCPYCYYMYEYDKVYEGCCLRCQNEKCRRSFHGVSIKLPVNWKEKGDFFPCYGYFPVGYSDSESEGAGGGGGVGFASWSPIVSMVPVKNGWFGDGNGNTVDISDESGESEAPANEDAEEGASLRDAECCGDNVGIEQVGNAVTGAAASVRMISRKMSVARNTRKMVGTCERYKVNQNVGRSDAAYRANEDRTDENEDRTDESEEVGFQLTGVSHVGGADFVDDVDFFEQDGELFVGLPSDDAF